MTMKAIAVRTALVLSCLIACPRFSDAAMIDVTDVAGRTVSVNVPVRRVILGEGRQLYIVAALDREDPSQRIVGWRNDFIEASPGMYQRYLQKFPAFAKIPAFSGLEQSLIDIETAVAQRPDIVILNVETARSMTDARYIEKLAALDIPVVYVDFRHAPMKNTAPTIRLFGKLFAREQRAEAAIDFQTRAIARITSVLDAAKPPRPKVFLERAGGYYDDCCQTYGDENFGALVELAGGTNIAKYLIKGTFGQLNPEQIIAADPEHIVVTSGDWEAYVPGGHWVPVGPGANVGEARRKLSFYPLRPAYTGIAAQRTGNFHAIWHQFYNSPYQFAALQMMAKWFHPGLFTDLDPDAVFREFHEKFLPITYEPGYFVSLVAPGKSQ